MILLLVQRFKGVKGSILRGNEYVFHDNGTLEIPVAQKNNAGTYTCVARNELGKIQNEVQLEIKGEKLVILSSLIFRILQNFRLSGYLILILNFRSNNDH